MNQAQTFLRIIAPLHVSIAMQQPYGRLEHLPEKRIIPEQQIEDFAAYKERHDHESSDAA